MAVELDLSWDGAGSSDPGWYAGWTGFAYPNAGPGGTYPNGPPWAEAELAPWITRVTQIPAVDRWDGIASNSPYGAKAAKLLIKTGNSGAQTATTTEKIESQVGGTGAYGEVSDEIPGTDNWYGMAILFPVGWAAPVGFKVVFQQYMALVFGAGVGGPHFGMYCVGNNKVRIRRSVMGPSSDPAGSAGSFPQAATNSGEITFTPGKWTAFKWHHKWSSLSGGLIQPDGYAKWWYAIEGATDWTPFGTTGTWDNIYTWTQNLSGSGRSGYSNGGTHSNTIYRSQVAGQADAYAYFDGSVRATTEADIDSWFSLGSGQGGSDPDMFPNLPSVVSGDVRYGNSTLFGSTGVLTADRKRTSKVTVAAGLDVHTIWCAVGATGTGSQSVRLASYDDDGAAGDPATLKATSTDKAFTAPVTMGWLKRTISPPVTHTAGDYWVGLHSGATTQIITIGQETLTDGLKFNDDTFTGGIADPFGTVSTGTTRINVVLEGTPVSAPSDTTAPVVELASVTGTLLMLEYDEPLDEASTPVTGRYTVLVNTFSRSVSSVAVFDNVVELTLASPVFQGSVVTVSYALGAAPVVQDLAGNDAAAISAAAVFVSTLSVPGRFAGVPRTVNPSGRIFGGTRRTGEGGGG